MASGEQDNKDNSKRKSNEEQASALFDAFDKLKDLDKSSDTSGVDIDPKPLATMSASISSKSLKRINVTPRGKLVKYETAVRLLGKKKISGLIDELSAEKETNGMKDQNPKRRKAKKTTSKDSQEDKMDPITSAVVEDIWKNLGSEKIDLSYAIVGYLSNGRPIIDHDAFVGLLINYGYRIDHVLAFIDDFETTGFEDESGTFPLVMLNQNMHDIYAEVSPLKSSIYDDLGLEKP